MWKRGTREYRNSIGYEWECRNQSCSHFGKRFWTNPAIQLENGKRISNKIPLGIVDRIAEEMYGENVTPQKICQELNENGIVVDKRTVTNSLARAAEFTWKRFTTDGRVKDLVGYRSGDKRYLYLLIDATPYFVKEGQMHCYIAQDHTSGLVIDFELSDSIDREAVDNLLSRILSNGYRPAVIISDEGGEIIRSVADKLPSVFHQYDLTHFERRIEEKLLKHPSIDRSVLELRRHLAYRLLATVHSPEENIFYEGVNEIKRKSFLWQKDKVASSVSNEFIEKSEHYSIHYRFPGCPACSNMAEGFFSLLDRKRKRNDLGRTKSKWSKHLANIIALHNRKTLDKLTGKLFDVAT